MAVHPDSTKYLQSIAGEISSQADRVRNLIGDAHWLSDGHHKEYVLTSTLMRHLPYGMSAGRGFVVSPDSPNDVSTEQDILIVDALHEAPVFTQGGLIVAFPRMVRAAISVKTEFGRTEIVDSIKGLNSVRRVCPSQAVSDQVWCGMFSFTSKVKPAKLARRGQYIANAVHKLAHDPRFSTPDVPPVLGPHCFCAANGALLLADYTVKGKPSIRHFYSEPLALAVFLHQLITHLSRTRGNNHPEFGDFTELAWTQSCEASS